MQGSDCSGCNGQHNCGVLHQQGGRYEIRLSLCPPIETSILVPSQGNSSESKAYSGSPEHDSRQAVQTQSGDPDRMVSVSAGVESLVFELRPTTIRPVRNPVQLQTPQVYFTGSGPDSLGSRRPESTMRESGC